MKALRGHVYRALDTERKYQDEQWPNRDIPGHPNYLTIGEFLLLIEEYTEKARSEWTKEPKPELRTLDVIRKIGGIVVNCMEQHGAIRRGDLAHYLEVAGR